MLEGENGHNYDTKYLGIKQALSGGWKSFAVDHGIKVGDVAVFQLVALAKFKASVSQYIFICLIKISHY